MNLVIIISKLGFALKVTWRLKAIMGENEALVNPVSDKDTVVKLLVIKSSF